LVAIGKPQAPGHVRDPEFEHHRFGFGDLGRTEVATPDVRERGLVAALEQHAQEQQRVEHRRLARAVGAGQKAHPGGSPARLPEDAEVLEPEFEVHARRRYHGRRR
jgi:hypothetical protein